VRLASRTTRLIAIVAAAGACSLAQTSLAQSLTAAAVSAVPTYEAVGLYWSQPSGAGAAGCDVRYRVAGTSTWSSGLPLWYDASSSQCRGSLVYLTPGTAYEAQMSANGQTKSVTFTTWSNTLPVAQTIKVPSGSSTLNITAGGSASGYIVYDGTGSTLDAQNASPTNINITASYVIVRGFTLVNAQQHGILIDKNQHDVVIEDNDISNWGRTRDGTWGTDMDSGIRAICTNEELTRVTIQRNKIHDPRYSANSWAIAHPAGPQGITFSFCGGNNVYRWNEVYSARNHYNDGIGGEDNFSTAGFPNKDSDLYGNRVEMAWDDGMEIEGGDQNVRVWGNYLNDTGTGISSTIDSVGPLYIFRNVWNRNQFIEGAANDSDQRQPMFKDGSSSDFGNGRRYLFHNTMLQAQCSGCQYGMGGGAGIGGTGDTQLVHNTVSMNNIYHLWKNNGAFYQIGSDNTFQNDMTNAVSTPEVSGIVATPTYASGNGWQSESNGMYQLAPGTPGYGAALKIANFNDGVAAPDVGAHQSGTAAMKFGVAAATSTTSAGTGTGTGSTSGSGTGTSTGTGTTVTVSTGIARPSTTSLTNADNGRLPGAAVLGTNSPVTGNTSGTASVSTTIDSSSYTAASGSSVTFTVRVMGNGAAPTGKVNFTANGNSISGCGAVAVSNGQAQCSTQSLSGGTYAVKGVYSGDSTYGSGVAGPITQVITGGSVAAGLTIDSSSYTASVGQGVTFTVVITGATPATGTVRFTDGGNSIPNCASVGVSNGSATCTTSSLSPGTHAIRGNYSGDGSNAAGVAGPITETIG
jgi:hypothetical protein